LFSPEVPAVARAEGFWVVPRLWDVAALLDRLEPTASTALVPL